MTYRNAASLALALLCLPPLTSRYDGAVHAQTTGRPRLTVKPAQDFEVTGKGDAAGPPL